MLELTRGNILEADAEALVNTVNCVGVMGKGLALQFKHAFPENFEAYAKACRKHKVRLGRMFIVPTGRMVNPKYIVNFPTKQHWRDPSRMAWVVDGLQDLRSFMVSNAVPSIALPALGAGLGGLPWAVVRGHIEAALGDLQVDVRVYEPL